MDYYHIYAYINGSRIYIDTVVADGFKHAIRLVEDERQVISGTALEITKMAPSGFVTRRCIGGSLQKSPPQSRGSLPLNFSARFGPSFMMNDQAWTFQSEPIRLYKHVVNGPRRTSYYVRNNSITIVPNVRLSFTDLQSGNFGSFDPHGVFSFSIHEKTKNFDPETLAGRWNYDALKKRIMLEKEIDFISLKLTE